MAPLGLGNSLPELPEVPDGEALGRQAYKLICEDVSWIHRRKEAVVLIDEARARRQISVDFSLPAGIAPLTRTKQGRPVRYAPLLLLRKAPSRFTRFDFRDEAGNALALPARRDNGGVSSEVLIGGAKAILRAEASEPVASELREIAATNPPDSHGLAEQFIGDRSSAERQALNDSQRFTALLWQLSDSSVVTVPIIEDSGERKVIKLSYDFPLTYLEDSDEAAYTYGFQAYLAFFDLPFIGAEHYHFEFHAPEGMEVVEAGFVERVQPNLIRVAKFSRRSVHFYVEDARESRDALAYLQLRVDSGGFLDGAALAATMVAVAVSACLGFAATLSSATTSAPSLLMLFPALVANYVARPGVHPLTSVLLRNARRLLLFSGGIALVAAARLSVISAHHHAAECTLRWQFGALTAIAWLIAGVMLAARSRYFQRPITEKRNFKRRSKLLGTEIEEID